MASIGDVDSFTLLSPLWVVVGWKVFCGFVVGGWGMGVGKKCFQIREEETRLVELWRSGIHDFEVLGKELGRTSRAIEMKLQRLGVVEVGRKNSSTTTAVTSRALLTHEETLRLLAGASFYCYSKGQTSHERNLSDFKKSHDFRGLMIVFGVCIACVSWVSLIDPVVSTVLMRKFVVYEEAIWIGTYGKPYVEYMNRTPRWIGIPKSERKGKTNILGQNYC